MKCLMVLPPYSTLLEGTPPCFSNTSSGASYWSLYYFALTLRLLSDWSSYEWKKGSHDKCPSCYVDMYVVRIVLLWKLSHDIMPKSIDQDGEAFGALRDTFLYLLWWSIDLLHDWVILLFHMKRFNNSLIRNV